MSIVKNEYSMVLYSIVVSEMNSFMQDSSTYAHTYVYANTELSLSRFGKNNLGKNATVANAISITNQIFYCFSQMGKTQEATSKFQF